jgi:hypothetical protein
MEVLIMTGDEMRETQHAVTDAWSAELAGQLGSLQEVLAGNTIARIEVKHVPWGGILGFTYPMPLNPPTWSSQPQRRW